MRRLLAFLAALVLGGVALADNGPVSYSPTNITAGTTSCFPTRTPASQVIVDPTGSTFKCDSGTSKFMYSDLPACSANPPSAVACTANTTVRTCKRTDAAEIWGCAGTTGFMVNMSGSGGSASGSAGAVQRSAGSGAFGTCPNFTCDSSTGQSAAPSFKATTGNFSSYLASALPSGFTQTSGAVGMFFDKPTSQSGSMAIGWYRGGAEQWAIGEDFYTGARSYFALLYGAKANVTSGAWSSNDMISVAPASAETLLAGSTPRVAGQAGADGPKYRFNGFFTPASDPNAYNSPFTYDFFTPTLQTGSPGDAGMHAAIFRSALYGGGTTVSYDSGGVQVNTTGARAGLTIINETNAANRRSAFINGGKGGSTGFSFGVDIPANDTQNWSVYDIAAAAYRLYVDANGGLGINTSTGSQFVTAVKTQNSQTGLQIDNGSTGTAGYASLIAAASGTRFANLAAFSTGFTGDATIAGDAMLYSSGGAKLHFGTGGVRRWTLDTSGNFGNLVAPTAALDVVGRAKVSTSINYPFTSTFPSSPTSGDTVIITDDSVAGACDSAGGSFKSLCRWSGGAWEPIGDGGSGSGSVFKLNSTTVSTPNLQDDANMTFTVSGSNMHGVVPAGALVNSQINASAAILDTKLATIATAGKVSNSATTATDASTASAIVARDANKDFAARDITARSFIQDGTTADGSRVDQFSENTIALNDSLPAGTDELGAEAQSTGHGRPVWRSLDGRLPMFGVGAVSTSNVNGVAATDVNLAELALPPGYLNRSNAVSVFKASGSWTAGTTSTPTMTFKIKLCTVSGCGSGTVLTLDTVTSAAATASTTQQYRVDGSVGTTATGATGTVLSHCIADLPVGSTNSTAFAGFHDVNTAASSAIDLTAALYLELVWNASTMAGTTHTAVANLFSVMARD